MASIVIVFGMFGINDWEARLLEFVSAISHVQWQRPQLALKISRYVSHRSIVLQGILLRGWSLIMSGRVLKAS
jgi:hypothetical protein